jgi:hypothetical protein
MLGEGSAVPSGWRRWLRSPGFLRRWRRRRAGPGLAAASERVRRRSVEAWGRGEARPLGSGGFVFAEIARCKVIR